MPTAAIIVLGYLLVAQLQGGVSMVGYLQMLFQLGTFACLIFFTGLEEDLKLALPLFHKRSLLNVLDYLKLGYQEIVFNFFDWAIFSLFLILYDQSLFSRFVLGTEAKGLLLEDWDHYSKIVIFGSISIAMHLSSGMDQACCILIGHQIGAFNLKRAKIIYREFIFHSLVIFFVFSFLFYYF
jgi:Na+-driven multidrug efflux pump